MINFSRVQLMPRCVFAMLFFGIVFVAAAAQAEVPRGFAITVVDDQTHRGVPLVQLTTGDQVKFFTDSSGVVFIDDSVLLGRKVFFIITSHGYEFPADGFGYHGKAIDLTPGGTATIEIHRTNIAQRLYRLTGAGIYRDSVLAGTKSPIEQPLINGDVIGQDSCQAVVYRGKIHWFFGDTARFQHPLGQFGTSGAVSILPADGGLDPARGVNLKYFIDEDGFSRRMLPKYEKGAGWLDALFTIKDDNGQERMLAKCDNVSGLSKPLSSWLLIYNDEKDLFEPLEQIPENTPAYPRGQPFKAADGGVDYIYFPMPFPTVRLPAGFRQIQDLSAYESYTCLAPGERFDMSNRRSWANARLDRDRTGHLVWDWKRNTSPVEDEQIAELIKANRLKAQDAQFAPRDVETNEPIDLHTGSVNYNTYRKKWILIGEQIYGKPSFAGEIWYSEADQPIGPWKWARRIVTHDRYSFYNPVQHSFFDQANGRLIYFQGTYSTTFSGLTEGTPRYDYNQMMYRLDLSDPRLKFPD